MRPVDRGEITALGEGIDSGPDLGKHRSVPGCAKISI